MSSTSSKTPSIPFSQLPCPLILGSTPLQLSYVLAFDGFPRFLDTGVIQSDRSLIAAFCGQRRDRPLTVQALSGMGLGEVGPLSSAVLCPCTLLPEVGLRSSPNLPIGLLGDAIPCHLWASVSSAERQIERVILAVLYLWRESPSWTCLGDTQNVASVKVSEHLSPQPSGSPPGVTLPLGAFVCV